MSDLPAIVSPLPPDLKRFLDRVREAFGDGNKSFVTKASLVATGVVSVDSSGFMTLPTGDVIVPPAPTGVAADGAIATLIVTWDTPSYLGHAYAEVWRAPTNNFSDAVLIGQSPGTSFSDAIGAGANVYYWVRFVSITNTPGPFQGTDGVHGTTSLDPAYLMSVLSSVYGDAPFIDLLTDTTIGGVFVPAGVYIKSGYIINAAIDNAKIADLAVDTAKISNGAIVQAKISNAAVGTAQIQTAAITTALIGTEAVTSSKIATASIGTAHITNAAITTEKVATAAIGTAQIADAAITNAKIYSLDASKITSGYISSSLIDAGSITASQIDSRGLTIKDSSGTVLFGAGTALDWSLISSQPSNIFNGNITVNSDGTLSGAGGGSVSLSGLGAGAMATIDQINSGNVWTYIGAGAIGTAFITDAAIVNAKIGNAEVGTLKVAGNAIGINGSISGGGTMGFTATDAGNLSCVCYTGGTSNVYDGDFVLVVDGTSVFNFHAVGVSDGSGGTINGPATSVYQVSLSAGYHTVGFYQDNQAYDTARLLWFFNMR